ncbi:DoxX family protein [soil metagenome]|jgi:uncharacterized membrane protein YphA (DoxX/SURF4 family)
MSTFLWVLQWVLAVAFFMAGAMKAFMPKDKMLENERMEWVRDEGLQRARTAGYAEIAGALGLVLPGLLHIAEWLTPLAALGLVIVMILAIVTVHRPRNESITVPAVLGVLALIVAIGRVIVPL